MTSRWDAAGWNVELLEDTADEAGAPWDMDDAVIERATLARVINARMKDVARGSYARYQQHLGLSPEAFSRVMDVILISPLSSLEADVGRLSSELAASREQAGSANGELELTIRALRLTNDQLERANEQLEALGAQLRATQAELALLRARLRDAGH